jgi:hypothetical protein
MTTWRGDDRKDAIERAREKIDEDLTLLIDRIQESYFLVGYLVGAGTIMLAWYASSH